MHLFSGKDTPKIKGSYSEDFHTAITGTVIVSPETTYIRVFENHSPRVNSFLIKKIKLYPTSLMDPNILFPLLNLGVGRLIIADQHILGMPLGAFLGFYPCSVLQAEAPQYQGLKLDIPITLQSYEPFIFSMNWNHIPITEPVELGVMLEGIERRR